MNKTGNPINIKISEGARKILAYYDHPDKGEDNFYPAVPVRAD